MPNTRTDVVTDESDPASTAGPTRRQVLAVTAVVAGSVTLVACGSSSSGDTTPGDGTTQGTGASGTPSSSAHTSIVKLADVPVGGAVSAQAGGRPAVVSQPTAGQVVAFIAICTHQHCTVAPAGKEFHCPCHGSVYDAFTGKVISGPAPSPLASIPVKVEGGEVVPA